MDNETFEWTKNEIVSLFLDPSISSALIIKIADVITYFASYVLENGFLYCCYCYCFAL